MISLEGSASIDPTQVEHLKQLLVRDTSARGTAASILNRESVRLRDIAQRITRNEIRDRPDSRRTPASLAHGKTYYESWDYVPAKLNGYALEVTVFNDHPFAAAVEKGTPAHAITPQGTHNLRFPFNGGARGAEGRAGEWAVDFDEGGPMARRRVKHPGAAPHRIMERALMEWRSVTPLRRPR